MNRLLYRNNQARNIGNFQLGGGGGGGGGKGRGERLDIGSGKVNFTVFKTTRFSVQLLTAYFFASRQMQLLKIAAAQGFGNSCQVNQTA